MAGTGVEHGSGATVWWRDALESVPRLDRKNLFQLVLWIASKNVCHTWARLIERSEFSVCVEINKCAQSHSVYDCVHRFFCQSGRWVAALARVARQHSAAHGHCMGNVVYLVSKQI